jgi:fermentation-respiration switch protein FrsA (DUF1100 family)
MLPIDIVKGSYHLAGLLYRPESNNGTQPGNSTFPGVVVLHPAGGVKEQTASTYAQRLSQEGFVTIAFDASYQGESGGLPHFLEDPNARVTDVSAVVDYLETLDYVDSGRIAVVGICAGGGYAAAAATGDHRLKALATVSAVNFGDGTRLGWLESEDPAAKLALLEQVSQSIQAESTGAAPEYAPYVPEFPDENTPYDLRVAHDYYLTDRAQHPNAQNKMLVRSTPLLMNFDAYQFADMYLTQSSLIIYGDLAESKWHSERLFNKINATNPDVHQLVVPGGRHMDFYDVEPYVSRAVEGIATFFRKM